MKVMNVARRFGARVGGGLALASMAPFALATETGPTLDVSGVTSFLGGAVTTAVGQVGVAVLLVVFAVKAYKWVRRAG